MTRVYLSGPYQLRAELQAVALVLAGHGFKVHARWLSRQPEDEHEQAAMDLLDVAACHVFVLWNPPEWAERGTGGRHVETGAALALGKPVIVCGERSNVFHGLRFVQVVDTIAELTEAITRAL